MAYTVLARKYRSATFDDVVGQTPIATTLANAIRIGRIHHGYLFTGTRGTGKTSMARILAKSLNCLKADAPTVKPCCACDACRAIAEGQDIDVLEIDAASNTGVDNIRELRGNTAYRPARSRFRIYIIDEVHMLSTGAFNALLKTLEEPPEHVKFILATTEIQKVPATIQSRCQRFNFRNIAPEQIAERLTSICKDEGAKADEAVLRRISRLAAGSMRDALSILDQILSVSPKSLTAAVLDEMLPPTQDEQLLALLTRAAEGDAGEALALADAVLSGGRGLEVFCNDLIDVVRSLMLMRACGAETPLVDVGTVARDEYRKLCERFALSHYVQMIAMVEELKRNVRFSAAGRALADAVIVRMARMTQWTSIEQLLSGGGSGVAAPITDEKKKNAPGLDRLPATTRPAEVGAQPAISSISQPRRPSPAVLDSAPPSTPVAPVAPAPASQSRRAEIAAPTALRGQSPASLPDASAPARPPVSADRTAVLKDPVVRQVVDLFEGVLVNVERSAAPVESGAEQTE